MAPDLRASLHDRRSGRFGVITAEPADYARFFHGMLDEGFYIPPSQVEAGFLSLARTKSDTVRTVETGDRVFKKMALE